MYIKITNGVPENYTIGQLRKDNPNVSFPKNVPDETLAAYDVYPCTTEEPPAYDELTQKIVVSDPQLVDGAWVKIPEVVDLDATEQAEAFNIRVQEYEQAVEEYLDSSVAVKGYDSIVSACSYAGAANRFQAEGQAAIAFRADVWDKCYSVLADVQQGLRTPPTIDELKAELPTISWP